MGNRYYITGTQLGMLMGDPSAARRTILLQDIIDKQHLGTRNDLKEYFKITKKLNEGLHKLRCIR